MTKTAGWSLGLLLASSLLGVTTLAVEIFNESFESPVVTGRVQTTPTGWKRVFAAQNYSGVWNEDTSGVITPYGTQVGAAWTLGGFQSTNLTEVVQPGTTYTLMFNVGNYDTGTGNPRSDNQYTAEILANETVMATVSGLTNTKNLSQSNTTSVVVAAGSPHIGKTLGVRLRMTGGDWHAMTVFDNVRLNAVESDEWKRSLFYGK
jgi:hypothetical protein